MNRNYKVIGITGTVGKTSTCLILHKYFLELQENVISFTTSGIYYNKQIVQKEITSTILLDKHKVLEILEKYPSKYIIYELTAESGSAHIYDKDVFDVMGLTNFKLGVVQSFKSDEDYLAAKLNLFNVTESKYKVINKNSTLFFDKVNYVSISYGNYDSDIYTEEYKLRENLLLSVKLNIFKDYIDTNLIGKLNIENIECVASCLKCLNVLDEETFRKTLSDIIIPGRLEYLYLKGRHIIIDSGYNGIECLYPIISKLDKTKVISVVCTYNFDTEEKINELIKTYRSRKGLFFSYYSRLVIFTKYGRYQGNEDNSLDQLTNLIDNYEVIENRVDAIRYACKHSEENDIILLIGKGDEIVGTNRNTGEQVRDRDIINIFLGGN